MAIISFFKILPVTGNEAWFSIRVKLNINFIILFTIGQKPFTIHLETYFVRKGLLPIFHHNTPSTWSTTWVDSDRIWERGRGARPRAELGKGENRSQAELKDAIGMRITTYIDKFKSNAILIEPN